jgi:uncharacterized coiled-coil protein SlyX
MHGRSGSTSRASGASLAGIPSGARLPLRDRVPGGSIESVSNAIATPMTRAEDIEEAPAHLAPDAAQRYLEARAQGLCHEGALEAATGARAAADGLRLETVEFKIAHLEKAVQELSDVIYRQQQQLDAALALNRQLRQQLEASEDRRGDPTAIEIPPHY